MKLILATLFLGALGAGSFQLAGAPASTSKSPRPEVCPSPCAEACTEVCSMDCDASVRRTGDDRCEITCLRPDGSVCTMEVRCDDDGGSEVLGCRGSGCEAGSSAAPESGCAGSCPVGQ